MKRSKASGSPAIRRRASSISVSRSSGLYQLRVYRVRYGGRRFHPGFDRGRIEQRVVDQAGLHGAQHAGFMGRIQPGDVHFDAGTCPRRAGCVGLLGFDFHFHARVGQGSASSGIARRSKRRRFRARRAEIRAASCRHPRLRFPIGWSQTTLWPRAEASNFTPPSWRIVTSI